MPRHCCGPNLMRRMLKLYTILAFLFRYPYILLHDHCIFLCFRCILLLRCALLHKFRALGCAVAENLLSSTRQSLILLWDECRGFSLSVEVKVQPMLTSTLHLSEIAAGHHIAAIP